MRVKCSKKTRPQKKGNEKRATKNEMKKRTNKCYMKRRQKSTKKATREAIKISDTKKGNKFSVLSCPQENITKMAKKGDKQ